MNLNATLAFFGAVLAAGLAVGAILQPPRNRARWIFAAGMLVLAVESLFGGLAAFATRPSEVVRWLNWRLCVMSVLPGVWLMFSLVYGRGNAREFLVRWRNALIALFLLPIALVALVRGHLLVAGTEADAFYLSGLELTTAGRALYLVLLIGAVLVLMNLERTFRASVGTLRWRIKYMVLGLGLLFVVRAYGSTQAFLFSSVSPALQAVNSAALLLACLMMAFSIMRAGYLDVELYPSHALLHNSLTVVLAGVYLFILGAFSKVVEFLGGDAAFALKAFVVLLALVVLTVLLLSERVRMYTRRFVSRHFQRPMYDYRKVWRTFTESTTSRVEQTDLCRAVVKLASDYFQILSVTIWLADHDRRTLVFGASTSIPEDQADAARPSPQNTAEIIRGARQISEPVDIDANSEAWASALRRCTPDEFQAGGHRVCVPLSASGQFIGVMTLGDRVGGVQFSVQDMDLLKCIGDQTAASLLNIQLSQRLTRSREMEAFQTMSAFFVHDLKNTASTLSLMLQNLPVHFNDPAFREDALRGISRTVSHINSLISRLSQLRQELKISPAETDLNVLVRSTAESLDLESGVEMAVNLQDLPPLMVDPDQFQKVMTNLVLNAREAVDGSGEVRIETGHEESWAFVSVRDNGCGMSREFMERSLFRPFQTTKKQGIGIGMFQSKMIVEAHHGRIEVESETGKGSTFRVWLPVRTQIDETKAAHS